MRAPSHVDQSAAVRGVGSRMIHGRDLEQGTGAGGESCPEGRFYYRSREIFQIFCVLVRLF